MLSENRPQGHAPPPVFTDTKLYPALIYTFFFAGILQMRFLQRDAERKEAQLKAMPPPVF